MKVTHQLLATTSHRVVGRVGVVMAVVEVNLVVMVEVGATNNHLNMEEVTTTRHQATTPLFHQATVSRASMVRVEVRIRSILSKRCCFPKSDCLTFLSEYGEDSPPMSSGGSGGYGGPEGGYGGPDARGRGRAFGGRGSGGFDRGYDRGGRGVPRGRGGMG